jgi:opacity protein-like surface antigen
MRIHILVFGLTLVAAHVSADPKKAATHRSGGSSSASQKSLWFGPQASFANESDLGVGARALWKVPDHDRLGLITSFDYFFPSGSQGAVTTGAKHWEVNGNVAYHFGRRWRPYVGPGLNMARRSADLSFLGQPPVSTSDTAVGVNVLGGVRRIGNRQRDRQYFAEARYEVKGGEQFLVSAGVLF